MSFHGSPPARWRRSTRCGASNACVEIARLDEGAISVRDTADAGPRLAFDLGEWREFVRRVRDGRFDHP
ncbi:DUF397 domain-containing protein [Actinomadura sp. 3N508]|uniref:DUF397 domain-containing protein n=1 Tax=Actinomadura sp. 3N508 TaxID=3375153 RepID=UPI00378A9BEE